MNKKMTFKDIDKDPGLLNEEPKPVRGRHKKVPCKTTIDMNVFPRVDKSIPSVICSGPTRRDDVINMTLPVPKELHQELQDEGTPITAGLVSLMQYGKKVLEDNEQTLKVTFTAIPLDDK